MFISGLSTSTRLSTSATSTTPELAPSQTGTPLVDLACLQALVEATCICKFCKEGSVEVVESQRTGLASSVLVRCPLCSACSEVNLMPKAGRFYECNRCCVVAARVIGHWHTGLKKFCGVMNLPPPVAKPAFLGHQNALANAAATVCQKSMQDAAAKVRAANKKKRGGRTCDRRFLRWDMDEAWVFVPSRCVLMY